MATQGAAQKLRIAVRSSLLLLNAPEGYEQVLGTLPVGVRIAPESVGQYDVVLLFVRSRGVGAVAGAGDGSGARLGRLLDCVAEENQARRVVSERGMNCERQCRRISGATFVVVECGLSHRVCVCRCGGWDGVGEVSKWRAIALVVAVGATDTGWMGVPGGAVCGRGVSAIYGWSMPWLSKLAGNRSANMASAGCAGI